MIKNDGFHKEELCKRKSQRRYESESGPRNNAKIKPNTTRTSNETKNISFYQVSKYLSFFKYTIIFRDKISVNSVMEIKIAVIDALIHR